MNATAQAIKPHTGTLPLVRPGVAELAEQARDGSPLRLTVWEERARKMGFPPSPR